MIRPCLYTRVVDDDGPSGRHKIPHPYLADGSANEMYIQAVEAITNGGIITSVEMAREMGRRLAPRSMPTVGMALIGMRVRASDIVAESISSHEA